MKKILEIGPGQHPSGKATAYLDKYNKWSGKSIKTRGKPVYRGEIENMKMFKDKSFDFIIAKHVLEHANDVEKAISELERVGKAGYIETPSEIKESLSSYRFYHKWIIMNIKGCLYITKNKKEYHRYGNFFEYLFEKCDEYNRFVRYYDNLFYTKLDWKDKIPYKIIETDKFMLNYNNKDVVEKLLKRDFKKRLIDTVVDYKKKIIR